MKSSEGKTEVGTKIKEVEETFNPIVNSTGEQTGVVLSGGNDFTPDNVLSDTERAKLQWEFEKFLANFTFFLDLGLKAVGLFYAVLGGILSIYFVKDAVNKDVVKFLLYAPLIMSIILGLTFFIGGKLWEGAIPKAKSIANRLGMTTTPDFRLLTWLLYVFGLTFLLTTLGLGWLIFRLV
jgi:hypothetical protein